MLNATISYKFVNKPQEGQKLDVSFKEVSFLRLLMMTSLFLVFLYVQGGSGTCMYM